MVFIVQSAKSEVGSSTFQTFALSLFFLSNEHNLFQLSLAVRDTKPFSKKHVYFLNSSLTFSFLRASLTGLCWSVTCGAESYNALKKVKSQEFMERQEESRRWIARFRCLLGLDLLGSLPAICV